MYRSLPYLGLFLTSVLLQVFLFDNLSISVFFNPLVYIAFLLLLPIDTKPIVLLILGLVLGVTLDLCMGSAGINLIATLLLAFVRPMVAGMLCGRDNVREGGLPSPERLGRHTYLNYLIVLVLIHHSAFFLLEALSWQYLLYTLLRILISSAASVGFIWIIGKIFTTKLPVRI